MGKYLGKYGKTERAGVNMKAMDIALLMTFFTLLSFVVFVGVCNVKGIQIQDSLINMFLGIVGTELASCGGIQIFKVKNKKNNSGGNTDEKN